MGQENFLHTTYIAQVSQISQGSQNSQVSPMSSHRSLGVRWGWVVVGLAVVSVLVRSAGLNRPLLGNFATKNVVLAMIARNWAEGRTSLWYPRVDVLVEGQRGLHLLEWPIGAYLPGALWRLFGGSLDMWGRACSVVFYTGAVMIFFLWLSSRLDPPTAQGAAWMLALSPVGIIYGQSFMLDASLVFFTIGGMASLDGYLHRGRWWRWIGAVVALGLLTASKIYLGLWCLLAGGWIVCSPADRTRKIWAWLALGLALAPGMAWYGHVMEITRPENPQAPYIFDSLRKSMTVYSPPDPLLGSAEFYRQVLDDLAGPVLTPIGFSLMVLGLVQGGFRRYGIWLVPVVVLVAAMPRKFFEMNYYWVATLPAWCLLVGHGWQQLTQRVSMDRWACLLCWMVLSVFAFRYAAKPAFLTPAEDRVVPEAGLLIQTLTQPEEPVVTMHGSTVDLLYYCHRPGWAFRPDDPCLEARLSQSKAAGAGWAVVVGRDGLAEQLGRRAPPLYCQTPDYRIYRLAEWQTLP